MRMLPGLGRFVLCLGLTFRPRRRTEAHAQPDDGTQLNSLSWNCFADDRICSASGLWQSVSLVNISLN